MSVEQLRDRMEFMRLTGQLDDEEKGYIGNH